MVVGTMQIQYYYLKASVGMTLTQNGWLQGARSLCITMSALLLYPLLSKRLPETLLCTVGLFGFVGSRCVIAFAPTPVAAFFCKDGTVP